MSNDFVELKRTTKDDLQREIERLQKELEKQKEIVELLRGNANRYQVKAEDLEQKLFYAQVRITELEALSVMQESTISDYERAVKQARSEVDFDYDVISSDVPEIEPSPYGLTHGLGISYRPNEGAKIYRVADPKGPLIPDQKFKGGELEISPGEGIHFGLHWG